MSDTIKLATTPIDSRFPLVNQTSHCWTKYNQFVVCLKNNDGDEDACKKARQAALSICPDEWTEKWDEERDEGTFAGVK